jgi:hypothetical protein
MSKTLNSVAVQEFDSEVKQAYQGQSNLRSTVTLRSNVTAGTYKFRKLGKGLANQKATAADVTPMDVTNSTQTATLTNWNAPEYTDIFDAAGVNFDEQSELAQAIGMALARREDQLIIDALVASGTSNTIAAGGANVTLAKLTESSKMLNDVGAPSSDRHILVSADGLDSLLNIATATSSDYNTVKALVTGEIDTFVGFKFHVIETRTEGGLPVASSIRDTLAYHKTSIGLAVGLGPKTEVNYIGQKTAWLCNGLLKAGAVARDAEGIVICDTDET